MDGKIDYKGVETNSRLVSLGNTTQTLSNLIRLQVLESRYNILLAIERYYIQEFRNPGASNSQTYYLQAALMALLKDLHPLLLDSGYNEDKIKQLNNDIMKPETMFTTWNEINHFLRELGLTKFDSEKYDMTRPEEENKQKGL